MYITMLIPQIDIMQALTDHGITVTGAFHIGAHECEELPFYGNLSLTPYDVVWIDAIPEKVSAAIHRGIPNVYHAVVTDKDDELVTFHVSNNGQSSSIYEFGTHSLEHPWVVYVGDIQHASVTVDSFFKRTRMDAAKYNFWNFDIQGAELVALKGATESLRHADALYLEGNEKELYQNCGLIGDIDSFLSNIGFARVLTHMTVHGWGDALYIRK
jgi:FkbM family methyltransferase